MAVKILPCIFNSNNKNNVKKNPFTKKKCLHYFLLLLFYGLFFVFALLSSITNKVEEDNYNGVNIHLQGDFINQGIEMIFMLIISIYLLKSQYFLHHIISLTAFIILGIFGDIILDSIPKLINRGALSIIMLFIELMIDSLNNCYQKYMLDKLYYPYWSIYCATSLLVLIPSTIVIIIILIYGNGGNSPKFISDFYLYFEKEKTGIIIGKIIIIFILDFLNSSFCILTLYNFPPEYFIISLQWSKLVNILIEASADKYYCIIIFIFQFFCLLIYLEVLELNFYGLNKNTRRNIELREKKEEELIKDIEGRNSINSNDSNIEADSDYFLDKKNFDENKCIELSFE